MVIGETTAVAVIGVLAAPIAAYTGWVLNRRKDENDISASITASASEAVKTIRETMDVLHDSLQEAQAELAEFRKENERLRALIEELERQ